MPLNKDHYDQSAPDFSKISKIQNQFFFIKAKNGTNRSQINKLDPDQTSSGSHAHTSPNIEFVHQNADKNTGHRRLPNPLIGSPFPSVNLSKNSIFHF